MWNASRELRIRPAPFSVLGASRRPPTPNFRFFRFFEVFGPFSGFLVVGEGAGGSGDPFSCSGIDFHARESNFHAHTRFFVPGDRVLTPEDGFSCVFGLFSWSGRVRAGPGTYFHAQESIFHAQDSIFHTQNSIFRLGDAWGTPGGLVLSCFNLS